jgi:hypothetical protein
MSGFASGGPVYHLDDVVQLNTIVTESIDGGDGKRRLIKMSLGGQKIVMKKLLTDWTSASISCPWTMRGGWLGSILVSPTTMSWGSATIFTKPSLPAEAPNFTSTKSPGNTWPPLSQGSRWSLATPFCVKANLSTLSDSTENLIQTQIS